MDPTENDKTILRDLAKKIAEIAALPIQQEKAEMWARHNDLKPTRPMVLVFPEGCWREMVFESDDLCEDPDSRGLEHLMRVYLYMWEHLRDDNVIEAVVHSPIVFQMTGYGVTGGEQTRPDEALGAVHYDGGLTEEFDPGQMTLPRITVDWDATERSYQQRQELFGDILTVEKTLGWVGHHGFAPLDTLLNWCGIEQLFLAMVDNPKWVHGILAKMLAGQMATLDDLEAQNALTLNNRSHYNGSGGVGYTSQLPQADFDGEHVRPRDLWAHATAQIFSEVSPAMHEEFALQYERPFLERFGLSNYGCCEPLHNKLDIVKTISNLRRISISAWADVEKCAAGLGDQYVYSWKPNPAIVAQVSWDPDGVRRGLRDFCEKTRGCVAEMILKDTHTCNHEPRRMWEWTQIAMEVAEEFA